MFKLIRLLAIALVIIFGIALIKYRVAYKVKINDQEVGYVANKEEFEKIIDKEILNPDDVRVAYVDMDVKPEYQFTLVDLEETNEEEIFTKLKESSVTTYRAYAIAVNGQNKTYVNTQEEAEKAVADLKEEYKDKLTETEISVQETFTQDFESLGTVELASAVSTMEQELEIQVVYEKEKKAATLDGVYFSVKPVTGTITSRFGYRQATAIVSGNHKGIDIGAPNGTPIVAAADGTVTYAGWMGGYGNLVIISHGNGIQTYYGHCSKIYASVGTTVKAGDKIAAVGTTGNSTGNHLHFGIRKNGTQVNPQVYVYK